MPISANVTASVRSALRTAGILCLLLSTACLASSSVPAQPLFARIGAAFNRAMDGTFGHLFRRHGKHRAPLGEGPLQVTANGGLDVGVHKQTLMQGQSTSGAAVNLALDRRTDQADVNIQLPLSYANGQSAVGQLIAGYSTPTYALTYGSVAGPADSQLSVAGFTRGLDLSLPRRRGTLDILAAVGTFEGGTGYHALGVRRTIPIKLGLLELTGMHAFGEGSGEQTSVLDAALIRSTGRTTQFYEVGYGMGNTGGGEHGALAWSGRLDNGGPTGYMSVYARETPQNFETVDGSDTATRLIGATLSRRLGTGALVTADVERDLTGQPTDLVSTFRQTYELSQPLKFGSISLVGEHATSMELGVPTITSSLGISATQNLHGTTFTESAQRSIGETNGVDTTQSQVAAGISREVLKGTLSLFGSTTHGVDGTGPSELTTLLAQYARQVGKKTQIVLSQQTQRSILTGVATQQTSTAVSVVRQIFNGMGLALTDIRTAQTGLAGGVTNSIGVQLTGPLSLGNALTYGRANPNMPAAVVGHVLLTDSTAAYGGGMNHGAANAVVVLDGTRTQRTDASGGYAFRLVQAGAHTISVEPASLGPGIVVDRENREIQVAGGQTASVDFYAGSFAGIGGRIDVHNGDGSSTPLAGVTITVDKDVSTVTGPDGRYQVGRLTNGSHTVSIDMATLPASVGLTGTSQRVVNVTQGNVTSVDWTVVGMAVIAGHVMYAPDAGMGEVRAAKDVYVLAEPGDHAAITNEDGSFALADLPPGAYTLSVDPDTVPDELGVTQGPDKPYTIQGGEHIGGIDFMLGAKAKDVVFSFSDQKKVPLAVRLVPEIAPPGAAIRVVVRPGVAVPKAAIRVESDLGPPAQLRFDQHLEAFTGWFLVPPSLQPGNYAMRVVLEGDRSGAAEAGFSVDNTLPLVSVRTIPTHPQGGHTIRVLAKILSPVEPGDVIKFEDGYTVALPPGRGATYAFDMRLWPKGLPYRGTILHAGKPVIGFVLAAPKGS